MQQRNIALSKDPNRHPAGQRLVALADGRIVIVESVRAHGTAFWVDKFGTILRPEWIQDLDAMADCLNQQFGPEANIALGQFMSPREAPPPSPALNIPPR